MKKLEPVTFSPVTLTRYPSVDRRPSADNLSGRRGSGLQIGPWNSQNPYHRQIGVSNSPPSLHGHLAPISRDTSVYLGARRKGARDIMHTKAY